ncbi:TIM barrel protein [Chloroflexota bacterium]
MILFHWIYDTVINEMMGLLFGTGGVPHSARTLSTVGGIKRVAELGLGCMEIEFVQGVRMGETSARGVADTAIKAGVKLSAHAPYFINFNAHEPKKVKASQDRLFQAAHIGSICGAESIVAHTAFYLGDSPDQTYNKVNKYIGEVLARLKKENDRVLIRPEIMGKVSQFGTIEEILDLSSMLEGVAPCIDFAHWHARGGEFNSYPEFVLVLQQMVRKLGRIALDHMHMHISGIAYGVKGEIKHLNLKDSDFKYEELLRALKDYNTGGLVICESPNLEEDALLLQATYFKL